MLYKYYSQDDDTIQVKIEVDDDDPKEIRITSTGDIKNEDVCEMKRLQFYGPGPKMSCSLASGRNSAYEKRRSKKLVMEPDPVSFPL